MTETIIVGVTDAPVTDRAIGWAVARAAARGQRLELLAVIGGALGAVGETEVVDAAMLHTRDLLAAQVTRIKDAHPELEVSTRVEAGNPVSVLISASAQAALLVIGSDYRGPDGGPARGAHGIRIAAGASCPVVVIPDFDTAGRSGVLVGVDGSPTSEHAVRFAAAEADRLGERLVAVSVWTPLAAPRNSVAVYPELYLTNMQAATEEILALALAGIASDYPDLEVERVAVRGYPSQVLTEHGRAARMIVVGTHGRGAVARFLLGSISHEVLGRAATVTAIVR